MSKLIDRRTGVSLRVARMLPAHFRFGVATSAYQIEGAYNRGGRGPSIWDEFLHRPGNHSGDTGDVACDHYNRYHEDVALMKRLNLDRYRFSIAWPRVMPIGRGYINQRGLNFYDRLVDELLDNGIEPFPTLYHWDLPNQLQNDYCGWLSRDTAHYFADYAAVVVDRLGDRVKKWTTFNEPEVIIAGYSGDGLAPGLKRPDLGYHAGHMLMLAHGLASKSIRAARSDAKVGIVLNFNIVDPADGSEQALLQARRRYVMAYRWFLDGLLTGNYPEEVLMKLRSGGRLPDNASSGSSKNWIHQQDMQLISNPPIDYLGINYYTRFVVDGEGKDVAEPGHRRTQMGWQIYPIGLTRLLEDLHRQFKLPPIHVTENGAALDDVLKDGRVNDVERTRFIADHLEAVAFAIDAGVDVESYDGWSFVDNLEWPLGYAKTFGMVHVDRATLKRTPKDSALWYSRMVREHRSYMRKQV